MFANEGDLMKFKNIDLVDYINRKHQSSDIIEIESEKNAINVILKSVNEDALHFFLERKDPLLKLLEIHQKCCETIKRFENTEKIQFKEEDKNTIYSKELEKKLKLFVEDTRIFLTEERYFVHSETFNDDKVLCVLTNDLLFIGEKISDGRFRLKRSISTDCIRMEINDTSIIIILDGSHCDLIGSKENIESFYESFQEISYRFTPNTDDKKINYDLIFYYLETRRYDKLREYSLDDKEIFKVIDSKNLIDNSESFLAVVHLLKNPENFCKRYFIEKFRENLANINKIQLLKAYIEDLFAFSESFVLQLNEYFQKLKIDKNTFIIIVEECYKIVIHHLEPRILCFTRNTSDKSKCNEVFELIENRLKISSGEVLLDFRYLIDDVNLTKPIARSNLEKSKDKIKSIVSEYLK